jgi:hypothetical protein
MSVVHSPTRTFLLPSYAEDLAQLFAASPTPSPRIRQPQFDPRVVEFLDIEALESSNGSSNSTM